MIYVWGAGRYGVLAALDCEQRGVRVAGFIDKNAEKIKMRLGLPVLELSHLTSPNFYIIIAVQNMDAIAQIKEYLVEKEIDFEVSKEVFRNTLPKLRILQTMADRLLLAKTYNKDSFKLKENAFEKIYDGNVWNSGESKSGCGSEIASTIKIRKALPYIFEKYNIKTFLDVPCGDFNWMKEVDKTGICYIGGDIVERVVDRNNTLFGTENVLFRKIDITKDVLPCVDMIFCKDCLQHLSFESIHKALKNFVASGSAYLLTTSYSFSLKNHDILDGDYRALNLFKAPFNLPGSYLYRVREVAKSGVELDKCMYLWKLSDIH